MNLSPVKKFIIFLLFTSLLLFEVEARHRGLRNKSSRKTKALVGVAVLSSSSQTNSRESRKNLNFSSSNTTDVTKVENCTIKTIKNKIIELVITETVPASIFISIWTRKISQSEKIDLVNQSLKFRGLTTFDNCDLSSPKLKINAENKHHRESKPPCVDECTVNETNSSTKQTKDLFCNPKSVLAKLLQYPSFIQLPFDKLLSLFAKEPNHDVKVSLLNQLLLDANVGIPLFTLSSCANDTSLENVDISKCHEATKNKSPAERMKMVKHFEETGFIPKGSLHNFVSGKITKQQLKVLVVVALAKSGRIPQYCENIGKMQEELPKVALLSQSEEQSSSEDEKEKLRQLIAAGYLPEDTFDKLATGEITADWIKQNISQNREFIMSQLPDPVRSLIESGKMPPEIEEAIFSGKYNKTEITKMIVEDDDLLKAMLPQRVLYMLKDQPVPQEIKDMIISGKNASEIRTEIENNEELLEELLTPSTFFFYQLFSDPQKQSISVGISIVLIVSLTFIMTSLGCTMTLSEIRKHAKNPKGVIIALVSQFIIMPASAYGLTQLFGLEMFAAIAVLICGCCPGGNLSNILAYAFHGDMNLSILMTTCSSVLGLGFMPLNIFLYSQLIIPLESGQVVPFDKIVINIALTIIPVGVGIAIRHYKPKWVKTVMKIGAVVLVCSMITMIVLSAIMFGDSFFLYFPLPVLGCCAILPLAGYTFGYVFAWIARENPKCRRTISVETGCQNVQLCSTVLKLAFDPIQVGVLFLMPVVYMGFQVLEAFLLISSFRLYNHLTNRKNKYDVNSDEKVDKISTDDDKESMNKGEENGSRSKLHSEAKELLSEDFDGNILSSNSEKIVDHETLV